MAVHGNTGGGEECMKQELLQQVENLVESALGDIHTAMLATILEYDPDECTVSVQPFASFLTDDGRKIPYPIIGSVPVAVMKSHGYEIAFPVQPGDVCLLIISEADTSPALGKGEEDIPMRFDLSNAIAIPGVGAYQTDAGRRAVSENAIVIRADDTEIAVKAGTVEIMSEKISLTGNLNVKGNISCSGTINGEAAGGG